MHNSTNCQMDFQPTPIYQLDNIGNNNIYIKREDFVPISFGGNKARKAINFFREIESGNYDSIVTYGSSHSNHCRVISNMAAARNLPCFIIAPEEVSDPTFNSEMMILFGARIELTPGEQVHNTIERRMFVLKREGENPYFIPGGGHGNLGTQAYVDCYEEIKSYEQQKDIHFDYIFFASGTGTTQAGLVCGQLLNHDEREIVGISIARKNPRGRNVVMESVHEYLSETGFAVPEEEIQRRTIFLDDYTGLGYGKDHGEVKETVKKVMLRYGIPLDSTYTGKAYMGMRDYLKTKHIKRKNVLFIHTGGTPLFFDDLKEIMKERYNC